MLKQRIVETLRFFDLQDLPLTLLELHKYLLAEPGQLSAVLNGDGEVDDPGGAEPGGAVSLGELSRCLDEECAGEIHTSRGFYFLPGRGFLVGQRLAGYLYGVFRERRVRIFSPFLAWLPFLRGAALGGSQAFGLQKTGSDIDLFVVTKPGRMWTARAGVTAFFQLVGLRRHGCFVANRFCLNHYVSGPKKIEEFRNPYTAMEYARHRPLVYAAKLRDFLFNNRGWMRLIFPNLAVPDSPAGKQNFFQRLLEMPLSGRAGDWLEKFLRQAFEPRIRREQFIIVSRDELSFHPDSKQKALLQRFFSSSETPEAR